MRPILLYLLHIYIVDPIDRITLKCMASYDDIYPSVDVFQNIEELLTQTTFPLDIKPSLLHPWVK